MDTRKKRRRNSVFDDTRTKGGVGGGVGGEGGSYGVDLDAETKGAEGGVCIAACNGARGGDDSNCHVQ